MYDCIIIVGPTASGKTSFAIELAKKINGEIVSADSQQIYKYLNIGTAKPTIDEQKQVRHHLIDCIEPTQEFSVSDFKQLATEHINNIKSKGLMPIVVGGTGFYVQSLLFDMSYGNAPKDDNVRKYYEQLLQNNGPEHLFNLLKSVDCVTAEKLHQNDTKRVIRALEICHLTNNKMSNINTKTPTNIKALIVRLDINRELLYQRINNRVDLMFEIGLLDEINVLLSKGITFDNQCMQAIGYKEWVKYISGEMSIADTIELIKKNTRNYAKRQITWFRNSIDCDIVYQVDKDNLNDVINLIANKIKNHE